MRGSRLWKLHHRGGHDNDGALRGGPDDKIEWVHTKDHLRYALYRKFILH